jgi:large subunit ribosomal protein L5
VVNVPNLKKKYQTEVIKELQKEFQYKNSMEVPRVAKVVVNAGLGEAIQNHKILDTAVKEIAQITGQKPVITKARKSIAGFKLREGMPIGCRVTLRGKRMYEFLDRLLNVALPRVRDFRGVSQKCFDGRGNYSLGIKDQIIFPEIDFDQIERVNGFSVTIVTTAKTDEEGRSLLKRLGMPFRA